MKQAEEVTKLSPANVPDEWFTFIEVDKTEAETVSRPSLSYWKDAWRRLRMNKMAMMGLVFLVLLTFMAIFGPMMTPYDVNVQDRPNQYQPPSAEHWFGTDNMGRDVFTRTWYGARISLFVGFVAAIIDVFIGIIWGGISGYKGGRTDNIMMRIIEILYGIPSLLVTILLLVVFGPSLFTIILALASAGWVGRCCKSKTMNLCKHQNLTGQNRAGLSGNICCRTRWDRLSCK